jgi:transforming growth factor-beta-induced protein
MKRFTLFSLLLVLSLVIAACAPQATPEPAPVTTPEPVVEPTAEPTAAPQSIVDIAVADGRFGTLVAAVQAAGLADTLAGEGPFTVFAPTDEAFAALPAGTVDALLADVPALTDILLYHVASGELMAADVAGMTEIPTLQGTAAPVTVDGSNVMIDSASIVLTDIEASNGVIHVIDAVILPGDDAAEPEADANMGEMATIADIAAGDDNFSTLVAALSAAGLVDTLQGEGPFTVFAPTNDAFAALPEGALDALLADPAALTDVLLYHVVAGKAMAADVVGLPYVDTVLGQPVLIKVDGENVKANNASIVATDIEASNGVIHVIDTVLLPPTADIVDTAVAAGDFTTLVTAVQAAGLEEALRGEGPLTVFAPTDAAFAALPAGTVEALLNDIPALTDILLYHVVDGRVLSADVVNLDSAVTLQGSDIIITVAEDGTVKINDAAVVAADILTTNGVIHVIDAVILPPAE